MLKACKAAHFAQTLSGFTDTKPKQAEILAATLLTDTSFYQFLF